MRRIPFDVQRDLPTYRVFVDFRNAVEQMMVRRGTLADPDRVFWGFANSPRRYPDSGGDDDGLAGSRVPRRPRPGHGGAAEQIDWDVDQIVDSPTGAVLGSADV